MPDPWEAVSVLVAQEFLAMAGLTVAIVGLEQTVWLVPLWLVFAAALYGYHS
ncbi:hypothetical protein ACKVMT_17295 [Halobacteriales archaeon Cl-PHB]